MPVAELSFRLLQTARTAEHVLL